MIFRDTSGTKTTRRYGFKHSALKILTDGSRERVLGAHLLGHNAGEVINLFALAIRRGVSVEELGSLPWTYPTMTSSVMGYLLR